MQLFNTSICSNIAADNSDETSKAEKYMAPHVLAMSATPIPRTLALALYGDVSLTQVCPIQYPTYCRLVRELLL